jgi:hypothetical protein
MLLFVGLIAVVGLIAAVAGGKSGAAAQRQLIPGHRYKMTFRATDTRRAGAPFAALEALTAKLAALGWTSTFLEPIDSEPDPFQWNAEAIWSGARTALVDGQNVFFLGVQDITDRADHHGRFDPDLPPAEEEAVTRALQFETDPQKLRDFAASLRPQFPIAADNLETRANALAVNPQAPPVVLPPVPRPPDPLPSPAPVIPPFEPPSLPPAPNASVQPMPSSGDVFTPGMIPSSVRPFKATGAKTQQNTDIQRALSNFFAMNPVIYPDNGDFLDAGFSLRDRSTGDISFQSVDGVWGPRSQLALWAFQVWSNHVRNTNLTIDGLPGPASLKALDDWT